MPTARALRPIWLLVVDFLRFGTDFGRVPQDTGSHRGFGVRSSVKVPQHQWHWVTLTIKGNEARV
jgi:hypothetical protein